MVSAYWTYSSGYLRGLMLPLPREQGWDSCSVLMFHALHGYAGWHVEGTLRTQMEKGALTLLGRLSRRAAMKPVWRVSKRLKVRADWSACRSSQRTRLWIPSTRVRLCMAVYIGNTSACRGKQRWERHYTANLAKSVSISSLRNCLLFQNGEWWRIFNFALWHIHMQTCTQIKKYQQDRITADHVYQSWIYTQRIKSSIQ